MVMHKSGTLFGSPLRVTGFDNVEATEFFVLIDGRTLERECFLEGIASRHRHVRMQTFASVDDWMNADISTSSPNAILIHIGGRISIDSAAQDTIRKLVLAAGATPVVLLGDFGDPEEVEAGFELGVRGYVPASVGLDSVIRASRLTSAVGGVFIPASSVRNFSAKASTEDVNGNIDDFELTARQLEVANALRSGKANKTIAYELQMCESTVKVHVRTIMKKLHASNRTQAAVILNSKLAAGKGSDARLAVPR